MKTICITQADDYHVHLRDGEVLPRTVLDCAQQFARAIVMPNLIPPITTIEMALAYRERILAAVPNKSDFQPLMTLYLTQETTPALIAEAAKNLHIHALKLYPAGATTHSASGVTDLKKLFPIFAALEKFKLPLLIHGEITDADIDIFDREKVFIDRHLVEIHQQFPQLRIVLEHVSTAYAVEFILSSPSHVGATITAHHLLLNRNDLLVGSLKPHHYCLPILKHREDQEALIRAATSGDKHFFLGTDSAPHAVHRKECAEACAGIYSMPVALAVYAEIFEQMNALQHLENFASFNGTDFYGLPRHTKQITLIKESWQVPKTLSFGDTEIIPFLAGKTLSWRLNIPLANDF